MSSIDEKLSTLESIIQGLIELKSKILQDEVNLIAEISSNIKEWDDSQMNRFNGNEYSGKFISSLDHLMEKIDQSINFLTNKYETLKTHRG